jgi:CheY-like chemotaxis protein
MIPCKGYKTKMVTTRMNQFTRILVLDDEKIRHTAFQQALIGMIVDHACTATEAIKKMSDHPYDLVFL